MKRMLSAIMMMSLLIAMPIMAFADAAEGDVLVTLGANLTPKQKEDLLAEMKVDVNSAQVVEVTNEEEHKYLGSYLPKAQIGTRAISSAKITIGAKNSGIEVESKNINYVSDEMYMNALTTAGVKDASVYVTAPFTVSGTGALTGLIKAYEKASGEKIPEEQKQVANEEMVATAELGEKVGQEKAGELVTLIKDKLAETNPKNDEERKALVEEAAKQINITLTDQDINLFASLIEKWQNLDINWNAVGDQLTKAKEKWDAFAESEEGKNFFQKLGDFLKAIVDAIASWFK
ncbi:hypothetical protein A8F94_14575 [Bacillus sp. FJAT-27225]|uniref:DUF1002 domain-containing protein n=1 Tax=Bacillus sp. FJAT-27225 TaxID=1743144 RepID=UPI00080C2343|nr:DUF1002 domain-containing protein [Bacillus sp. FJAT-27225]OCA86062.1 hypothetical protein A8F94_14575 [Bacillus sp. FJAT-27225]